MNRYLISTQGRTVRLYYHSMEEAMAAYPDAEITPYCDTEYLSYIRNLIGSMELIGYDYRKRPVYSASLPMGKLKIRLSMADDGVYFDFCEYQFHSNRSCVYPSAWTMSEPKPVWDTFFDHPHYTEVSGCCRSKGQKISKPRELTGLKNVGSVRFGKVMCKVYMVNDDVYIKHMDYFSPTLKPRPEDVGLPLSVLCKKYLDKNQACKTFIYPDAWGSIVLQNVAWLRFEHLVHWVRDVGSGCAALWMRDEVFRHLGFKNTEGQHLEWLYFLDEVCRIVMKITTAKDDKE